MSFAIQIISGSEVLQKCTSDSFLKAVINIAQTGLTLNPFLKYAYLVPRKNQACLEPSYIGLAKLLTDTGSVTSIEVQIIHQGDEVEINIGAENPIIKHTPHWMLDNEKGEILGLYSKATLPDGSNHYEFMSRKDVEEIRERSEAWKAFQQRRSKALLGTLILVKCAARPL